MEWKIWVIRVIKKISNVETISRRSCAVTALIIGRRFCVYRILTGKDRKK